jgi:class 3 adenylate cyclase
VYSSKNIHNLKIILVGMVLFFEIGLQNSFSQNKNSSNPITIGSEQQLDSLLIDLQNRMEADTAFIDLIIESERMKQLIYEYNNDYILTKNLYFLDYKLMRQQDLISRAILRYWLGVFLHNQSLDLSALEVLKPIENDVPIFLIPDYYLLKGKAKTDIFDFQDARNSLYKADSLYGGRDSIRWDAKKQIAYTYQSEKNFDKEIDIWIETLDWLEETNNIEWMIAANRALSLAYVANGEYDNAIPNLSLTYDLHLTLDPDDPEIYQYFVEIAIIFRNRGETKKAIGYLNKALKPMKKSKNLIAEARIHSILAEIYFDSEKYDDALKHNKKAISIAKKNHFDKILAASYLVESEIEEAMGNYISALKNYKLHLALVQEIVAREKIQVEELWKRQYEVERGEKEFTLLIANEELQDFELEQLRLEKEKDQADLNLLKQQKTSKEIELQNQVLKANDAQQELKISRSNFKGEQQTLEIENLKKEKQISELIIENQSNKEREDQDAIKFLKMDNELAKMDIDKQRNLKNRTRWIGSLVVLIAILLTIFLLRERNNRKIINEEKLKSDRLLLNILPKEIADQIKASGKAAPKVYTSVSVLFTDFSGFTRLSEKMTPTDVLKNLETMFSKFDEIAEVNNMERIKTIGDGYMCAGGLPVPNENNAIKAVEAGLEFLEATRVFNEEQEKSGMEAWKLRIGINTGPVVAGVIGIKKFAYDIWGDTVNLASRAESHGVENQLNITENTYQLIKETFECEHRGEIEVKNLGKVNMYIVKGFKA